MSEIKGVEKLEGFIKKDRETFINLGTAFMGGSPEDAEKEKEKSDSEFIETLMRIEGEHIERLICNCDRLIG